MTNERLFIGKFQVARNAHVKKKKRESVDGEKAVAKQKTVPFIIFRIADDYDHHHRRLRCIPFTEKIGKLKHPHRSIELSVSCEIITSFRSINFCPLATRSRSRLFFRPNFGGGRFSRFCSDFSPSSLALSLFAIIKKSRDGKKDGISM